MSKIDKQTRKNRKNNPSTRKAVNRNNTSTTRKVISKNKISDSDLSTKTTLTSKTKVAKNSKKTTSNINNKVANKTKIPNNETLDKTNLEVSDIKATVSKNNILYTKDNTENTENSISKTEVLTKEILANENILEINNNLASKPTIVSKEKIENDTTLTNIDVNIDSDVLTQQTDTDTNTENTLDNEVILEEVIPVSNNNNTINNSTTTDTDTTINNTTTDINNKNHENHGNIVSNDEIDSTYTQSKFNRLFNQYTLYVKPEVNPANPNTIPKFVDLLPKPKIATPLKINKEENTYNRACYNISMEETTHKFNKFFPPTTVWGYDGLYPGPTIEAKKDTPIYVKWTNNLPEKHLLPVDHTLHGTNDTPDVRSVVHLHGANVESESDGSPDAWYTKNYTAVGPKFTKKIYKYTNHQPGTMLWYHDHTLGSTRLNVYAGLAGLYIIRDSLEKRLNLPSGDYEYPIMIQDKSFNDDGSLFYPDGPTPPALVTPSIAGGFFGDTIVVNGKTWPYLNVEPRKYRFRIINTCNARPLTLSLSNDEDFYQIGTDGGFVHHTAILKNFSLEPAERIDVIVDFSKSYGKTIDLLNTGFNADRHTGVIMRFKVCTPLKGPDRTTIPSMLSTTVHIDENLATKARNLPLSQSTDEFGRPLMLLDNRMWSDPTTETPKLDSIEIWNLINTFPFPHPIHVHLVQFMILDRTPYDVELYQETGEIKFTGPAEEPHPYEIGFKDTCSAEAGKVTRIAMQFKDFAGEFAWHCHVLEHEDHDMMRPLRVLKNNC